MLHRIPYVATVTTLVVLSLILGSGCGLPVDSGSSLDEIRGGVLRAGVVKEDARGKETLQDFAAQYNAKVEFEEAPSEVLLGALKERKLHIVYGKIDKKAVLATEAPPSRPYSTLYPALSTERATPTPNELDKTGVAPAPEIESLWLRTHSSLPIRTDSPYELVLTSVKPPEPILDLPHFRYVFLVAPGESRLLLELDRFIFSRESDKS